MDPSALSATSWQQISQTEGENDANNLKLDDEFDLMEYLDEEFVARMGQGGLETYSSSSSCLMNMGSIGSSFSSSNSPVVLNFTNPNSPPLPPPHHNTESVEEVPKVENTKRGGGRVRPPSQTYDHILAERRRREQLSRHFVALSTIVPGLKKMDKTSILGDAITHLKYLQERVKILEEESRKKSIESVVFLKKTDDNNKLEMPKIEARVCDAQILVIIECEYQKGLLTKVIATLENLNLTIHTTQATRFGILLLQITIITKMEKEFNSSVNQVLKTLHACCNQD